MWKSIRVSRSPPLHGAALVFMLCTDEANAHGLGARYDLPLPLWMYLCGAAFAVAASFAFLALFQKEPRPLRPGRLVLARGRLPPWLIAGLQFLSLLLFVLIVAAGLFGNQNPFKNIAPVFVWVVWWVGMSFLAAFLINPWCLVNPAVIAWEWSARIGQGRRTLRRYPHGLGAWPAGLLFLLMAWFELVAPGRDVPRNIAIGALVYCAVTWAGCRLYGPAVWLKRGDPFAVAFSIFGRFAPFAIAGRGRRMCWWFRPYAVGLLSRRPLPASLMAFTLLMLATVTADGLLETPAWAALVAALTGGAEPGLADGVLATMLLAVLPFVFAGAYLCVVAAMRHAAGEGGHGLVALAGRFVLSLVPIAIAYHLAHYLSFLLLAGQFAIPLASDPFGRGWDLFGTALYRIDIGIVDARFVWFLAVGAIVTGHVLATWLAHETALAVFRTPVAARRSQIPMLLLMVGYTVMSLWILSQPIVA